MQFPLAVREALESRTCRWLVTGAAGFIGSHLVGALLELGQAVVGLDNLSVGSLANLERVRVLVGEAAFRRFSFVRGDVCDLTLCRQAMSGVTLVLHQAALASVPQSLQMPLACHAANVNGFCAISEAARQAGVRRVVYASSSAVYGEGAGQPSAETMTGPAHTPYALSKLVNEHYAATYARCFGQDMVGLRYFNVYGPRQSATGPYAAVIPLWFEALFQGRAPVLYGEGRATRDFCYVGDVVRANLLAALANDGDLAGEVVNVGTGRAVTLLELYAAVCEAVRAVCPGLHPVAPRRLPKRNGDLKHSRADTGKAEKLLGFFPQVSLDQGLALSAKAFYAAAQADGQVL